MYYYSVLYAEDDLKTREIFSEILKGYFTEVCSVQNGLEAMKKFDNTSFDIVITDISMPKVGGLELSKHIKSRSPNTPILLISAQSDYGTLSKAIDIGVDGYVLKPIDADTFIAQISKIIKKLEDAKKITPLCYFAQRVQRGYRQKFHSFQNRHQWLHNLC